MLLNELEIQAPTKKKISELDSYLGISQDIYDMADNMAFSKGVNKSLHGGVMNTVANFFHGFAQGFTTLPTAEWAGVEQYNTVDAISHSIGSLLGFIGVVPGGGTMAKMGVNAFIKAGSKTFLKHQIESLATKMATKNITVRSVPMLVADGVMNKITKSGMGAKLDGIKFLAQGTVGRDMLKTGLHLGIASGVGSAPIYDITPETFINERLIGFGWGAGFGAGNAMLGNMIGKGLKYDFSPSGKTTEELLQLYKTNPKLAQQLLNKDNLVNNVARAVSSSIIFGMPSTVMEQPLEIQVYEYLLNGFFGYREPSRFQKQARDILKDYTGIKRNKILRIDKELGDKWEKLPKETRDELLTQADFEMGGVFNEEFSNAAAEMYHRIAKAGGDYKETLDRQLVNGEITQNYYNRAMKWWVYKNEETAARKDGKDVEKYEVTEEILENTKTKVWELANRTEELLGRIEGVRTSKDFKEIQEGFKDQQNKLESWGLSKYEGTIKKVAERIVNRGKSDVEVTPETITENLKKQLEVEGKIAKALKDHLDNKDEPTQIVEEVLAEQKVDNEVKPIEHVSYKGGFENTGKGTSEGDGKDKAMRRVATTSIVEIANRNRQSSSLTTEKELPWDIDKTANGVVMLARNKEFRGKDLDANTKQAISDAHNNGAEFVVGDMPNVDTQFIDYLNEIGAKYTIYHTGDTPRAKGIQTINQTEKVSPASSNEATKQSIMTKDFSNFINGLKAEGIEVTHNDIREIKNLYNKVRQSTPRIEKYYDPKTGKVHDYPAIDPATKKARVVPFEPTSPMERIIDNIEYVKEIQNPEADSPTKYKEIYDRSVVGDEIEDRLALIVKDFSTDSEKVELSNLSDVKKKEQISNLEKQTIAKIEAEFQRAEQEFAVRMIQDLYNQNRAYYFGKKQDPVMVTGDFAVTPEQVDGYLKKYIDIMGKDSYEKALDEWVEYHGNPEIFDHLYVNNIELWRKFNFEHIPFENLTKKHFDGHFADSPTALNKRTQLLLAREPRLDPVEMEALTGISKPNFIILNAVNKSGSIHGMFDAISPFHKMWKGDKIASKLHEAGLDGGVILRHDVFDMILQAGGLEDGIGVFKGTTVSKGKEDNLGGMLGKYAMFRANEAVNKWMVENDVHQIHYDTTVKQRGNRGTQDWKWDGETINVQGDLIKYNVDWNDISVTKAEHLDPNHTSNAVPRQYMLNLPADLQPLVADKYIEPMVKGDDNTNAVYEKYLNDKEPLPEDFNPDKLSLANKMQIINSNKDTPEWRKLAKIILGTEYRGDDIADAEMMNELRILDTNIGTSKRILQMVGDDLTPAFLELPGIRTYWDTMVKKYVMSTFSPKTNNSHVSVLRPNQPGTIVNGEKYQYRPDHFVLARDMKNKIVTITINGKDRTGKLGDLWQRYGKKHSEAFEFVVIRTPADSASGIRILKFDGFSEDPGNTIQLHSKDYIALGGADNDIDTANILFNEPKKVKDYYKSQKDQWYKDGAFIDKGDELLAGKLDLHKHSPLSLYKANKSAAIGNSNLGPGLSLSQRLISIIDNAEVLKLTKYIKKDARENVIRLSRDIVNTAADSADGFNMLNKDIISEKLYETVFDFSKLSPKERNAVDKKINSIIYGLNDLNKAIRTSTSLRDDSEAIKNVPPILKEMKHAQFNPLLRSNIFYKPASPYGDYINDKMQEFQNLIGNVDKYKDLHKLVFGKEMKTMWADTRKAIIDRYHSHGSSEMANDFARQLYIQDISDIASAYMVVKNAENLPKESVKAIREKIAKIKQDYINNRNNEKDVQKQKAKQELIDQSITDYAKELNPEERVLFESLLLSSVRPNTEQSTNLYTRIVQENRPKIAKLAEAVEYNSRDIDINKYLNGLIETYKNIEIPDPLKKEVIEELFKIKDKLKEAQEQHYSSNIDTYWLSNENISPNVMRQYAQAIKEVVNLTFVPDNITKKPTVEEAIFEKAVKSTVPEAVKMVEDKVEQIGNEVRKKAKENLDKLPKDFNKTTIVSEEGKKLEEILIKNPKLLENLPDIYTQYTAKIGGIGKTFDEMTAQDFKRFVAHLEKLTDPSKRELKLQKWDYFRHPGTLIDRWEGYDTKGLLQQEVILYDAKADKIIKSIIQVPTSRMEKNIEMGRRYHEALSRTQEEATDLINKHKITKVMDGLGEDRNYIFEYVVANREIRIAEEGHESNYEANLAIAENKVKDIKNKVYNVNLDGQNKPMEFNEVVQLIDNELTQLNYDVWKKYLFGEHKSFKELFDKEMDIDRDIRLFDMETNRVGHLGIEFMQGKLGYKGIAFKEYLVWLHDAMNHKFPIQDEYGRIVKTVQLKDLPSHQRLAKFKELQNQKMEVYNNDTKEYEIVDRYPFLNKYTPDKIATLYDIKDSWYEGYFPHLDHPRAMLEKRVQDKLEEARRNKADEKTIRQLEIELYTQFNHSRLDDFGSNEDILLGLEGGLSNAAMQSRHTTRSNNLLSRSEEPLSGYNISWKVYNKYLKGLATDYWKGMSALIMHHNVDKFVHETITNKNNIGKDNAETWSSFMRQGIREILGYPAVLPTQVATDPRFKIKGNFYHLLTEDYYARKHTIFDRFFGVKDIKLDETDPDMREKAIRLRQMKIARKTSAISALEGKWSLMSLLFSPKTYLVNRLTADINTTVSAGFRFYRQAGNLIQLKQINPEWKSWDDVYRDVYNMGGIESFIKSEVALSTKYTSQNTKQFIDRLIDNIKSNPKISLNQIREIARQEGVSQELVDTGALFMRYSERQARAKAWLAHYLKAREVFQATKYQFDWNDPWLIEMANKGVEATQFLYNDAMRPQFARTSLGKMFTRFQLFAMNSMLWRKNLTKDAIETGWNPNTEEYQRLSRLASADLFVMALGSMLPYSIFNNALPPPWNYFEGSVQFLFGDKETRERAFYGVLPYPANIVQPVLPPSSRVVTNTLNLLLTGDLENFAGRQVPTWFPFGRMVNDTRRAIENPMLAPERMLGIPFVTAIRKGLSVEKRRAGDVDLKKYPITN